jgi:putative peptidoglycan lipid II flippase
MGAAAIVMSSTVFSRITGFIREIMIPSFLGVNETSDAYTIAFMVPDLMYSMLVGGAIAAALIPVLSGYIGKKQEEDGWKALSSFINISIIAMLIVSFLGIVFAPQLVKIVAAGYGKNLKQFDLTVKLTRILFPSISFLMLAGLTNGVLNSYKRFAAAAYGPVIYNLGSAFSIFFFSRFGVEKVAVGVACSAAVYFLIQFSFAFRHFRNFRFKIQFTHPGFLRLYKLAIPSLISSSIMQVNIIISTRFATLFQAGSVTAFKMADRTWQMPLGIIAQGLGVAMLPTLSEKLAIGEVKSFKDTLIKVLKTVLMLSVPSAVAFLILRKSIITTLFRFTGNVTAEGISIAAGVLMVFSIALMAQSIATIMNRAFYAGNDTKTPLFIGTSTVFINIALSFLFYYKTDLGIMGMALSYSLSSTLNAILLLVIFDRKMKGIHLNQLVSFTAKIVPASLVMGIALYYLNMWFPQHVNGNTWIYKFTEFGYLSLEVFVGAGLYFFIAILLKVEEAVFIRDIVFEKLGRFLQKPIKK